MPSLDLDPLVERVLEAVEDRRDVLVSGDIGSGRTTLFRRLSVAVPHSAVIDLVPIGEVDAPAVGILQALACLPDELVRRALIERLMDIRNVAAAVSKRLRELDRVLLLRVPASWRALDRGDGDSASGIVRAADFLRGLQHGGARMVAVADPGVQPRDLFVDATGALRLQLPDHRVPLCAVELNGWGDVAEAAERLTAFVSAELEASPLAWRLAVGAVHAGCEAAIVARAVATPIPFAPLVDLLAGVIPPVLATGVRRFLAARRALPLVLIQRMVPAGQRDFLTKCVGYGDDSVTISPVVRVLLHQRLVPIAPDELADTHLRLADHFELQDGATSPGVLGRDAAFAWVEKVHHLAYAGEAGNARWSAQEIPTPELYWDRGRYLSVVRKDHAAAAEVYRQCTIRFPRDDYAWHYLGYNRERMSPRSAGALDAYRRAVELAPENPWWNGRLVRSLIADGRPREARDEWAAALGRVDPDADQVSSQPWLADNLHYGVATAWLEAGRPTWAAEVLFQIPRHILNSTMRLDELWKQVEAANPNTNQEPPTWRKFVDRSLLPLRDVWLRLRVAGGPDLPIPIATSATDDDDGAVVRLTWSYRSMILEIELAGSGAITWYARNRTTGISVACEDPEIGVSADLAVWLKRTICA